MTSAVVFAYHNVGARCLRVLLAHAIEVPLVVTHEDNPGENIWFERVADVAADYSLPSIAPRDPGTPEVMSRVSACAPDFLFSFYYRAMLSPPLIAIARRGALNMHGSLLPNYRGRAPVNWAVLRGERRTGATLHYMAQKPDAGDIVAQQAVPILPDDSAKDVLDKVAVAAEILLDAMLPALVAGTAPRIAQDLRQGSYFGGRTPEDGRIDWSRPAQEIHNLVRAVAPPYPGAFTTVAGTRARVLETRIIETHSRHTGPSLLEVSNGRVIARCAGGGTLALRQLEIEGRLTDPTALSARFDGEPVPLGP